MSDHEVRIERMSPSEIDVALSRRSTAYLPLGALEAHGEHLPIGTDGLNAHGLCVQAAQSSGGVVLPVIWQGVGGEHINYRWTIMMPDDDGIRLHLSATLDRLQQLGVKRAVIITGHFAGEQTDLVDSVASAWNEQDGVALRAIGTSVDRCGQAPIAPDHAGAFESGILGYLHPELMHLDRLGRVEPNDDPNGSDWGPHRHDPAHPLWGIFGPDPRTIHDDELVPVLTEWLSNLRF